MTKIICWFRLGNKLKLKLAAIVFYQSTFFKATIAIIPCMQHITACLTFLFPWEFRLVQVRGFSPLLYHKSRSLLISRCLHSVSAPIFLPIQSSASWRCCCCCFICSLCLSCWWGWWGWSGGGGCCCCWGCWWWGWRLSSRRRRGGRKRQWEKQLSLSQTVVYPPPPPPPFLPSPRSSTTSVRHPSQGKTPCARRPTHRLHHSIKVHRPLGEHHVIFLFDWKWESKLTVREYFLGTTVCKHWQQEGGNISKSYAVRIQLSQKRTQKLSVGKRSVLRSRNYLGDFSVNRGTLHWMKRRLWLCSPMFAALPLTCATSGPGVCPWQRWRNVSLASCQILCLLAEMTYVYGVCVSLLSEWCSAPDRGFQSCCYPLNATLGFPY